MKKKIEKEKKMVSSFLVRVKPIPSQHINVFSTVYVQWTHNSLCHMLMPVATIASFSAAFCRCCCYFFILLVEHRSKMKLGIRIIIVRLFIKIEIREKEREAGSEQASKREEV